VLFGSIFGISSSDARTAALIGIVLIVLLAALARPLLFASLDADVAAARGVPVRALGPAFLAVVGATAAEATQVVGALLLFGLLAAPAAAAQRLVTRPWPAVALSAGLAVVATWGGLVIAYAAPTLPPSFAILAVATGLYVMAVVVTSVRGRARTPRVCG